MTKTKVLIVGGGFGGVAAALESLEGVNVGLGAGALVGDMGAKLSLELTTARLL